MCWVGGQVGRSYCSLRLVAAEVARVGPTRSRMIYKLRVGGEHSSVLETDLAKAAFPQQSHKNILRSIKFLPRRARRRPHER